MKHIIIIGDGMADRAVERLGGKTPLQHAYTPCMDLLAKNGRCGRLQTIPEGFQPGSEVAITAILGYDLGQVYEGRGPLEAVSTGYRVAPDDLVLRCNLITVDDGKIATHNGGDLPTDDARRLIGHLNHHLADDRVRFIAGEHYRHLLVVKGGSKHIVCAPPHDHLGEPWRPLLIAPSQLASSGGDADYGAAQHTAALLNSLIIRSQTLLAQHPYNQAKAMKGEPQANSIWPWSGGHRPRMVPLRHAFPQLKSGTVVAAASLIRGIGHYAGLNIAEVPGATGLSDTNYEGKAQAALRALKEQDFVLLHIEAPDEASHCGDLELKLKTIEDLDRRIVGPVCEAVKDWREPVAIALLPDHPTPVALRTHTSEPVPFLIYYKGIEPDAVETFDEVACARGSYGLLRPEEFFKTLMQAQ